MFNRKLAYLIVTAAALCAPATASAAFMHVVAPGESLSSIAAQDGLTVSQLAAANGLSSSSPLVAGSSVAIPAQTAAAGSAASAGIVSAAPSVGDGDGDSDDPATTETVSAAPATASVTSSPSAGGYLVQPGDTLSAIAARYGVTVSQLAADNGLSSAGVLLAGSHLTVPGATATGPATGVGNQSLPSSGTGAQPTPEAVSPSQVGSIAAADGVPASLAEGIAYQESGFNNNLVSPTGATGVMQIEPGTWNYIGRYLGGTGLSASSATDNVRGGVMLLHSLLNQTGGNPQLAAAGYYQGLQSVMQHGMYPDTQQYVNDVMALSQRFGGQ